MQHWGKYFPAIVDFAKATRNKSKDLLYALHGDGLSIKDTHKLNAHVYSYILSLSNYLDDLDSLKAVRFLAY